MSTKTVTSPRKIYSTPTETLNKEVTGSPLTVYPGGAWHWSFPTDPEKHISGYCCITLSASSSGNSSISPCSCLIKQVRFNGGVCTPAQSDRCTYLWPVMGTLVRELITGVKDCLFKRNDLVTSCHHLMHQIFLEKVQHAYYYTKIMGLLHFNTF